MLKNRNLIYLGFIIPLIFWSTTIICGLMTENYNHLTNMVSELGAIGTRTQYIFTIGMSIKAILSIFFILGLYRTAKELGLYTIPIIILLTFSFSALSSVDEEEKINMIRIYIRMFRAFFTLII